VKPAVVNITSIHTERVARPNFSFPDFPDLRRFFGFQERRPFSPPGPEAPTLPDDRGGQDEVLRQQALGSGFIVDSQGRVVTNAHVIDDATTVKVKLADDREFRAKVIGKDDRLDIAVLELKGAPRNLPAAALGSSDALRVGEYAVAIGNPFGLGDTVTMGIVSAKDRSLGAGPYDDFIQTDASINPGNSGGPLFNLRGQVIGINAAINPQGKGIGFAIPIDAVRNVLPQLIGTGHVVRGRLGVGIQGVDQDLAKALGMDRPHGALVEKVESASPAEAIGIRSGDVIVAVDGHDVTTFEDLPRLIARHAPGTRVKLTVLSDKRTHDVEVTLAALKDEGESTWQAQQSAERGQQAPTLGVGVVDDGGHAVITRVSPDGPSDGKLRVGDIIEEVDHHKVTTANEVAAKLATAPADRPVLLHVRRGDQSLYVAVARQTSR
jgi:serine protease Do